MASLGKALTLLGVGMAVTGVLYKNEKVMSAVEKTDEALDRILHNMKAKRLGMVEENARKKRQDSSEELVDKKERMTNFYKSVLQANGGFEFGQPIEEVSDLEFSTYSEAKVKMLDVIVGKFEADSFEKREIYSLIMDYGNFVRTKLDESKIDNGRTENFSID